MSNLFRPGAVPRFATAPGAGRVVEPIEYTRINGFDDNERPPGPWFNWMFNASGGWIDFLLGPNASQLTRTTFANNFVLIQTDDVTAETTDLCRRVVALDDSNAAHVWATVRGNEWVSCATHFSTGNIDTHSTLAFTGDRWVIGSKKSTVPVIGYTDPSPSGGTAIDPAGSVDWTQATTPGGMTALVALAAKRDPTTGAPAGGLVGVTQDKIIYSTDDGVTFANASTVGTPTGPFDDVLWTGQHWVAVTNAGVVWTSTTAAGAWSALLTLTGGTRPRRLATDGLGTVVAYPVKDASADAWWVSANYGASFASQTAPAFLTKITHVRYILGAWFATSENLPYLAVANDLAATSWLRIPVPILETGPPDLRLEDVTLADGALIFGGVAHWLLSTRASDVAPGTYAPSPAPLLLHDAAYLRGQFVAATSTSEGVPLDGAATANTWDNSKRVGAVARVQTPGNTTTTLDTHAIAEDTAVTLRWTITGRQSGGVVASWVLIGTFYTTAGAASQIGSTTTAHHAANGGGAAWTAVLDVSGANARVRVTGAAATTIDWTAQFDGAVIAP